MHTQHSLRPRRLPISRAGMLHYLIQHRKGPPMVLHTKDHSAVVPTIYVQKYQRGEVKNDITS